MPIGDEFGPRPTPYQQGLANGHCGPECGMLGGHFRVDDEDFLILAGYDPAEHPEVVEALKWAVREAIIDTASDVLREHGLYPPNDLRAPMNGGLCDA